MLKAFLLGVFAILLLIPVLRELYFFMRWRSRFGRRDHLEWSRWLQSVRSSDISGEHSRS